MIGTNSFLSVAGVAPIALAGGSGIFAMFLVLLLVGVIIALYTRTGSGITERPYGKIYGGAPGAFGPGSLSGHDDRERVDWSRGTR